MARNRAALLAALGIDNFGSGLFLPVVLLYVTRVVGLPLATAGTVVSLGTIAGLAAPPLAGRLVDTVGPRPVVICSQVLQAAAAVFYLAARGVLGVAVAAAALAAGQQLFYSSLFALISDVAGHGPKDRPFAVTGMIRSACFGLGGLAAAALLSLAGPAAYRIAVAVDAASFVACALLLAAGVRVPRPTRGHAGLARAAGRLLRDRPFLAQIVVPGLVSLAGDVWLSGISVYLLAVLHTSPWLPGALLAVLTALGSAGATFAVRATRRLARTTTMALAAAAYIAGCAASLAAILVPPGWRPLELFGATLVLGAAGLLFAARTNALAEAAAPEAARGRYLAAFQYAFTIAGVIAPGVVALFSVAVWLPWLLVATCCGVAIVALRRLSGRLPARAVRPGSSWPGVNTQNQQVQGSALRAT